MCVLPSTPQSYLVPPAPKISYRRVLGIDPAVRHTGWGILDASGRRVTRIVKSGVYHYATTADIQEFALAICKPDVRPDLVAIEGQYFNKNVAVLIALVEMRMRIQVIFELLGIPVVIVAAQDWQLGLLNGLITRKSPRKDRKAAAALYIKRFHPGNYKSQDEIDAIAIAVWAVRADLVSKACLQPGEARK